MNLQTPLAVASYHGNLDVVKYLVQKGANPELSDADGWTVRRLLGLGSCN